MIKTVINNQSRSIESFKSQFRQRGQKQMQLRTSRQVAIDQSSCNNEQDGEYGIQ